MSLNLNTLDDYHENLARIERARQALDNYQVMNEEAKNKLEYQQELARKIADGDRARQELEMIRQRDALALTAPQAPRSLPQAAPPVYAHTTARIEEIPTYGHAEQRNVYPSNSQHQWRVQRQEPNQQQHQYPGTPQHIGDSTYRPYYAELQNRNQQVYPTNQPTVQSQQYPAWSTYIRQGALQQFRYQEQPWPQVPAQAPAQTMRPKGPEVHPQMQRIPASHRDGPQQGTTVPVSNPPALTKPQPNSVSSTLSGSANASSSVAGLEPVQSAMQKSDLTNKSSSTQSQTPTVTPTLYKPTSDVHLHGFTSNLDVIRYLTASHAIWTNDMPANSYYPIPNTQYYVWKTRDNILQFAFPTTGHQYTYVDFNKITQHAFARPSSRPENTQPTTTTQVISLSPVDQTTNFQSPQVTATTHTPLPSTEANTQPMATHQTVSQSPITRPQTETLQAAQLTITPVSTEKSHLSTQPQHKQYAQPSPRRTPADADKKSLARDVIRALGLKRPRPLELPETQTVERPAKRHVQEPVWGSSTPFPNGTPGVTLDIGTPSPTTALLPTTPLPAPTTSTEAPAVRSPSTNLPSVRIVELPTEPEPKQSVKDVAAGPVVESLVSAATQSSIIGVDETTDDAANTFNRLSIEEQTVAPVAEGELALQAQIEELEEGEIQVPLEAGKEVEEEEGEIHVPTEAGNEAEEEEGEIHVPTEAGKGVEEREGEIHVPTEAEKEDGKEEIEAGEIKMTQLPNGGKSPPPHVPPIRQNVEENAKRAVKTPLFLPSPSPSPQEARSPEGSRRSSAHSPPDSSAVDEDSSAMNSVRGEAALKREWPKLHVKPSSRRREFCIVVPPPPSYVRKYKEQEKRKRKRQKFLTQKSDEDAESARSSSESIADPHVQMTIRNSATRIAERRCKWGGCDSILNSSQNLFEHLKRNHSMPDSSKRYILCSWSGCGDHVRNEEIEEHMTTHAFPSFLCPYADCDESFRSAQALVRHNDMEHTSDELKSTPDPFSPNVQEPPPIPSKVPDYIIKSGLVRQEPIPRSRHAVLGPWVYNNIAGPVKVTKRYNAARDKPAEYGFLQSSAMQFSTNPSQPAKNRDLGDLPSGEVSEMISEGLFLWPPQKTPAIVVSGSEDELDGFRLMNNLAMTVPSGVKLPVTRQSSEEATVETMLTGQPGW